MKHHRRRDLVLSVFVTSGGLAFTLFEGPLSPVDWGAKEMRGAQRNARCTQAVADMIKRYYPDILVIEDYGESHWRRAARIARLYKSIEGMALVNGITVCRYARDQVRGAFERFGATTKQERAVLIAHHIPAFSSKVPPQRKIWMSEHPRMGLFEAAALNLTYQIREVGEQLRDPDAA